jgi:hypothetical protein
MSQNESNKCPACRAAMVLADITSGLAGYDIRTFQCPECPRVLRRIVKFGDLTKCVAT